MITNEIFEQYWNDPDNLKVMRSVVSRYRWAFGPEEEEEHMQMALVRCLGRHDPGRGPKFTSSLHRFTRWECLNAIRDRTPHLPRVGDPVDTSTGSRDEINHVYECMDMMDAGERDLIVRYYLEDESLRELAEDLDCSHQTVSNRLGRATETLRDLCVRNS